VDPLSLLQVSLLRNRAVQGGTVEGGSEPPARHTLESVLSTTLSGIAQGLRNTE
jgi:phosphoenolpyruvate carboxylase